MLYFTCCIVIMKTGIVISLAISSRGNKIFRAGDEVNENNFPNGNWAKAVNAGHIKENETSSDDDSKKDLSQGNPDEKDLKDSDSETNSKTDTAGSEKEDTDEDHSSENKIESFDDISEEQMKKDLRDAGIGFSKKADKETLYQLWITLKK